ncbi:MAG: biopolymer transporter ExbD [Bacteroidota bacterium]
MAFKSKLKPSIEFSTSSMADIVFLLLIFFLLTSQFVTDDAVQMDLPKSESDQPAKGNASVTITKEGTYKWKSEELGAGEPREVKEAMLVAEIEGYLTDSLNADNRVINFRGDTAITYGAAAVVIAAVAKHGGSVAFQTRE